ncbi:hypothetical protein Sfum_1200 [Syntrophobacter fumaroxidans MPOB]|uniref:Uncharacterized protein n=1 Tax=Syntrophobacter fumaroxidans (strain DSM 10017 / MPOB) TaxID=335543 RepID=A0LHJ1_SYNFM|nr:hypothetical protein Sfum_1200 [Syntrophobacter fumaroxidans MPOB]
MVRTAPGILQAGPVSYRLRRVAAFRNPMMFHGGLRAFGDNDPTAGHIGFCGETSRRLLCECACRGARAPFHPWSRSRRGSPRIRFRRGASIESVSGVR